MDKFKEYLKYERIKFYTKGKKIIISKNNEEVYLVGIKEIKKELLFNNNSDVYFDNIIKIKERLVFNNKGDVYLIGLIEIPKGIIFNNGGNVLLEGVTEIKEGLEFNNKGFIYLEKVKDKIPKKLKNKIVIRSEEKGNYFIYMSNKQIKIGDEINTILGWEEFFKDKKYHENKPENKDDILMYKDFKKAVRKHKKIFGR